MWFPFPHLLALGLSPTCVYNCFPRWIPAQRPMERPYHHRLWVGTRPFWLPRSLLIPVQCLPCPKEGKYVTTWSSTQTGFSPSVPAMTVIIKCPQETKPGYLPCSCYYFCFEVQNRWLIVNTQPRAHLPPSSGSVNRRLVVNASPGAHLPPASLKPPVCSGQACPEI